MDIIGSKAHAVIAISWSHLIFIQFTIFVFIFALVLKGDDNKTYEDVDHEEGDNDDVDNVEDGHDRFVVVHGTVIFLVRVDRQPQEVWPTLVLCAMIYD